MHHSFDNRAFHLILLLFVSLRLSSTDTTSAEHGSSPSSPSSANSSSCDPSSKSCSPHSQETETRIQQLKDSSPTQAPVDPPTILEEDLANETDSQGGISGNGSTSNRTTVPEGLAGTHKSNSSFHLRLPSLKLPQRDFFSITDRINALRNLFQSIINLDRELIWHPIVPSRMSRGSFLVKLFSNLLKIMPFPEVSGAAPEPLSR